MQFSYSLYENGQFYNGLIGSFLGQTGFVPPPDPVAREFGAGAPAKKRRYVVEVDGEDHLVDSPEEAAELLRRYVKPQRRKRKNSRLQWVPDELPKIYFDGLEIGQMRIDADSVLEAVMKHRILAIQSLLDDLDDEEAMAVL